MIREVGKKLVEELVRVPLKIGLGVLLAEKWGEWTAEVGLGALIVGATIAEHVWEGRRG